MLAIPGIGPGPVVARDTPTAVVEAEGVDTSGPAPSLNGKCFHAPIIDPSSSSPSSYRPRTGDENAAEETDPGPWFGRSGVALSILVCRASATEPPSSLPTVVALKARGFFPARPVLATGDGTRVPLKSLLRIACPILRTVRRPPPWPGYRPLEGDVASNVTR